MSFRHRSQRGYADACEFLDGGGAERPPIEMRIHRHERATRKTQVAHAAK
jgi:hypothetical protein